MTDILLIEDNEELAGLICTFLLRDGYTIMTAYDGETALAYLRENSFKMVLVDIMLPGMDGFAVCKTIRENNSVPVIIMSARVDKEDKINGFLQGADDYVEKPIDIDILSAKVKALMRRNYELKQKNTVLKSGWLTIDKEAKQIYVEERLIPMTAKEYELLLLLAENPGKVLHKEYLFHKIWGADSFSENQTLTVHIKMLRDKIEEDTKNPKRIITVWGVGYRYEEV